MIDGPTRTVFLGSGAFAVPSLRRLAAHSAVDLIGVVTAPPRPAGRSGARRSTPIHQAAGDLGLAPVLVPDRLRDSDAINDVQALDPEMLVLADYGQIVPTALLAVRHGALNLHPSLLPRHRGASPIPATILAGDAETGVTLMRMDEGLDSGPIVAQHRVRLAGTETAPALEEVLAAVAADLLADHLEPWIHGELALRPQPTEGATLTRPLRREDGRLDAGRPTAELERQVRALQPWPGTYVEATRRIKVFAAEAMPPAPEQEPFTLTSDDAGGIAIATIDGRLRLLEVQSEGGRRMTGAEFTRGLNSRRGFGLAMLGRLP